MEHLKPQHSLFVKKFQATMKNLQQPNQKCFGEWHSTNTHKIFSFFKIESG